MNPRRLLAVLVLLPGLAAAQSRDEARVDANTATRLQGVASLNLAAGTGNAQANLRSIAMGDTAIAQAFAAQHVDAETADRRRDARAVIANDALAHVTGVLGLNQAAGAANAQVNVLAIGTSPLVGVLQTVDNAALAATAAPATDPAAAPTPSGVREARIDAGALAAPTGVLQINQTAGVGNASANAIVLQLPGSAP